MSEEFVENSGFLGCGSRCWCKKRGGKIARHRGQARLRPCCGGQACLRYRSARQALLREC